MSEKITFIIGAGASKEANLPTGMELKQRISKLLDIRFHMSKLQRGDTQIVKALKELVRTPDGRSGDINPYLHKAWHIRDALPQAISIDNFIDSQSDNEKIAICGKLAIIRSILEAEKNSLLYFDRNSRNPSIRYTELEESWYLKFFQLLTEYCGKDDLEERFSKINLIIFNYDRCIEHFLFYALQNYYKITQEEASELLKQINIYHPYGSVGELKWQNPKDSVGFGAGAKTSQMLKMVDEIKTFTEGTDPDSSNISSIKQSVGETDKLVFLGFAFHKLNMELITPDSKRNNKPECFATTYGISNSDQQVIQKQINELYNADLEINMKDIKCADLFNEFWRSLAF